MTEIEGRWVARLTATRGMSIDALLALPMGLDVWERHGDVLVVAASEAQLSEMERRRLARVERMSTVAEFEARAQTLDRLGKEGKKGDKRHDRDREGDV